MKFVLILTMFGIENPNLEYFTDYNLTGEDCIERLQEQQKTLEQIFHPADFQLACSIDDAPNN